MKPSSLLLSKPELSVEERFMYSSRHRVPMFRTRIAGNPGGVKIVTPKKRVDSRSVKIYSCY